jgi:DNA-binding NarL/FixJ family response regulator
LGDLTFRSDGKSAFDGFTDSLKVTTAVLAFVRPGALVKLRILLADDHAIVRQAIRFMLQREGFEMVGEASDGQQAVKLCGELQPHIAVLDLSMPVLNGLEAAREILKACTNTKVVILTEHAHERYLAECLDLGAKGYVLKSDTGDHLVNALNTVSRGETYVAPSLSLANPEPLSTKRGKEPLGIQERRVLQLIAEGKSTKAIAELLDISYKTVQSHRTNVMSKLGLQDIAGLVRYAIRCGLVQP